MSHDDLNSIKSGFPVQFMGLAKSMLARANTTSRQVSLVDVRRNPVKKELPVGRPWGIITDPKKLRTFGGFSGRKKPAQRFSTEPGIPLERFSEVPRVPTVSPKPENRFSVPSLGSLTGGRPVVTAGNPTGPIGVPPVSLHKSILKGITGGLSQGITGRINQAINPQKIIAGPAIAGAAGVAARVLPSLGRVLGSRTVAAAATGMAVGGLLGGGGGNGVCASGWHLNKQDGIKGPAGTYCVRNRRMNFGNARAARRGVRRLKGARKLLRDIEKMMPSKTRARRAPAGHSAHLHHTGGS